MKAKPMSLKMLYEYAHDYFKHKMNTSKLTKQEFNLVIDFIQFVGKRRRLDLYPELKKEEQL